MEAFKKIHLHQLSNVGFPDHLWEALYYKIASDSLDGGEFFEFAVDEDGNYVVVVQDGLEVEAFSNLWLIDHAWTTTLATARKQLHSIPGLLERMENLMEIPPSDEEGEGIIEDEADSGADLASRISNLNLDDSTLSLRGLNLAQLSISKEQAEKCNHIKHIDLRGNDFSDYISIAQALASFSNLEAITTDFRGAYLFHYVPSLKRINSFIRSDIDARVAAVYNAMWRYNQYYSMGTSNGEEEASVWYIMDELGSRIPASTEDTPANIVVVPFFFNDRAISYSIAWPVQDLHGGELVVRDYLPNKTGLQKKLIFDSIWGSIDDETRQTCEAALDKHQQDLEDNKKENEGRVEEFLKLTSSNSATTPTEPTKRLSVFTNMQIIRTSLAKSETFTITDNKTNADILWLYDHFYAFSSIATTSQFINQFPGEKCIVVKDLLLSTVNNIFGNPSWLPVTYNMENQLKEFLGDHFRHSCDDNSQDRVFIVKPWNLARGIGHVITDNLACMLRVSEMGPKVASLYLTNPALYDGKKFDLRYVVALKSVEPLEVYVHKTFLVRFANKTFSLSDFEDYEKHLTVMTFVPFELKEVQDQDFIAHYTQQRPKESNKSWEKIEAEIFRVLKMTFAAACLTKEGLVNFANSRAIYGADIILDERDNPHLLEMNYCPNCTRLAKYEPNFFEDIFQLLFCNKLNSEKLVKL